VGRFIYDLRYLLYILLLPLGLSAQSPNWKISREWSEQWERRYSDFIAALGESDCNSTTKCINSPANPYRSKNPEAFKRRVFADCADLPYILRGYFAFVNELPFAFTNVVQSINGGTDLRYSPNGNKPASLRKIRAGENVVEVFKQIADTVSSGHFRMPPQLDVSGTLAPDFYSPFIHLQSLKIGTNVYDPNGHVAIVYKIEKNGRVHMMDAHPDNSISRIVYGKKFVRTRPSAGAGFKNWRPTNRGAPVPNASIADYSLVQYFGTHPHQSDWSKGEFKISGVAHDYYDYVREMMAGGNLRYDPIEEFRSSLAALCADIKDRANAVELAVGAKIHLKSHPVRLPNNIYGTEGEWETYSSPSRDARLKTAFVETREAIERFVDMANQRDPKLIFDGTGSDLVLALRSIYEKDAPACVIHYQTSDSEVLNVALDFATVEDRLFKLSFDPYHCAELRWGAENSCRSDSVKHQWYVHEQRLRNQTERSYDVKMGFSLDDLKNKVPGSGVDAAPAYSIKEVLGL
jgi:hypothetical protein